MCVSPKSLEQLVFCVLSFLGNELVDIYAHVAIGRCKHSVNGNKRLQQLRRERSEVVKQILCAIQ